MRRAFVRAILVSACTAALPAEDVILPKGWKTRITFTSLSAGIDGRLTRLLNDFASPNKDIYQFGVYTGNGLKKIAHSVKHFGHLYGFDSFQGIPEEPKEEQAAYWTTDFRKGGYSAADAFNVYNLSALMGAVAQIVNRPHNLTLIPGFFSSSLTPDLLRRHRFQPALHVDVDVDIFTSTMQCLEWMFINRLIVPSTFVRYDDWPNKNATHGAAKGTTFYGQKKAHALLTEKFRVKWKHVARARTVPPATARMRSAHRRCAFRVWLRLHRHVAQNSYQVMAIGDWACETVVCDRAPWWQYASADEREAT